MRRLSLDESALSDGEYSYFTASRAQLVDDDGAGPISLREARAWLRGRYAHLPPNRIDTILDLVTSSDFLSRGQFYAVLRLVLHAEAGKEIDRSLGFVQASPPSNNPFKPKPVVPNQSNPPLPPRKPLPPPRHLTSTLIQQSLQASKTAQSLKRAEDNLERERVFILKSTSARSTSPAKAAAKASSSTSGSDDGVAPALPRRPASTVSPNSVQHVALAGTSDRSISPPPTHPARKPPKHTRTGSLSVISEPEPASADTQFPPSPSIESPTSRIIRSKSMHTPSPPPPPPSRRRRPESFQYNNTPPDMVKARTLSGTDSSSPFETPLTNFQRTLATFQPKLDKARFKAEAGLSKRGFVPSHRRAEDQEGLMPREESESVPSVFDDAYAIELESPFEKENDKWPLAQGWKPL